MNEKIKVLIVDDSAFMRNILERMIKTSSDMEVVGKAENGLEAVELVKSLKPDVVTLDIEMPKMNGLEALKVIMKECPTSVVMVSSLTEQGAKETIQALELGAIDFIPKALDNAAENIFKKAEFVKDKITAASRAKVSGKASRFVTSSRSTKPTDKVAMPKMSGYLKRASYKGVPKLLVIGSSTGGPKALSEVISGLKSNLKVPTVIAQHMPEGFTNALADRMDRSYDISVKEAEDGEKLNPGCVYIAPGGKHLRVENRLNTLYAKISGDKGESPFRPSVNVLAESANKAVGANCVAVMLTGMGSDGAKEFKTLKESGAYVITQDEETCTVYGMPKSVVDLNASDEELSITQIATVVNALIK
ncbi:MAG TPA: chemotaxis response regulator protein-glutamate methylesterase [Alphaproteobacteria bacterium]|nr:chemotaxis response regulator protein-glutamate methylesterase [Alphaproteobacteria bacterium]